MSYDARWVVTHFKETGPVRSRQRSSPQRTRERRALRTHLRPHLHTRRVPLAVWGHLWPTLGSLWLPLGCPWPPFGRPLGSLWLSWATLWLPFGCPRTPFGRPLGSLWPSWGPRAGSGARPGPGPARPWASEEKPKKALCFYRFFYCADAPPPDGKDNLAPVEDLLNENPSHVALGKNAHRQILLDVRHRHNSEEI